MPSIWMNYPSDSGCTFHRFLSPARFCNDALTPHGWSIEVGDGLPDGHDVYMLHGLPTPYAILEIGRIKSQGKKFVWSLDDDWLSIPDWNPANPGKDGLAAYAIARCLADYIVCSTPALAATFADMGEKVMVAPNLLDLTKFPDVPMGEHEGNAYFDVQPKLPVRVVWVGGVTHSGDIAVMTDALDRLMDKYGGNKMVVIYQGMLPPSQLTRKYLHRCLYHQPMTPFASYQKILNSIEPHVYLCPLAPIPFNQSKSNLRVMESWALFAAPVASDWGEYACIKSGVDGRLVMDGESWYSALARLVTDHEYRIQLAANGYMRVKNQYDWNNPKCRQPWVDAFLKIAGVHDE